MTPEMAMAVQLDLPRDEQGPVFAEPWQARAFALTLRLHQQGCFSWQEWVEQLSLEIAAAELGAPDAKADTASYNARYYRCWLAALEKLVSAKSLLAPTLLEQRRRELEQG